jgi:hypothetical protein
MTENKSMETAHFKAQQLRSVLIHSASITAHSSVTASQRHSVTAYAIMPD